MNTKSVFCVGLVLLIALFATMPTAIAQIPCGPTSSPSPTLFVNWPQFQFDAGHSGCNPYEYVLNRDNAGGLRVKWAQDVNAGMYSSSVVANGVLYVARNDDDLGGSLLALNAITGAEIWSLTPPDYVVFSGSVVANGVVYAGAHDYVANEYNVYALNARTGTLIWKYETTGTEYSTLEVAVANGMIYASLYYNKIFALNASTGALVWEYPVDAWSLPAVANGVVYIGSDDHNVYALDANTGAFIWSYPTGNQWPTTSVVSGVVYVAADKVYALNASSGALIWEYPIEAASHYDSSPAVANGIVYIGSGVNVYALNAGTGALVWKSHDFCGGLGCLDRDAPRSPAIAKGVAYVPSDYAITALDLTTGAVLWSQDGGRWSLLYGSPTVANGMVYVSWYGGVYGSGTLQAFSLNGQ
jgi:eukaryotic-like serine/threonine-protein kinase